MNCFSTGSGESYPGNVVKSVLLMWNVMMLVSKSLSKPIVILCSCNVEVLSNCVGKLSHSFST